MKDLLTTTEQFSCGSDRPMLFSLTFPPFIFLVQETPVFHPPWAMSFHLGLSLHKGGDILRDMSFEPTWIVPTQFSTFFSKRYLTTNRISSCGKLTFSVGKHRHWPEAPQTRPVFPAWASLKTSVFLPEKQWGPTGQREVVHSFPRCGHNVASFTQYKQSLNQVIDKERRSAIDSQHSFTSQRPSTMICSILKLLTIFTFALMAPSAALAFRQADTPLYCKSKPLPKLDKGLRANDQSTAHGVFSHLSKLLEKETRINSSRQNPKLDMLVVLSHPVRL